MKQFLKSFLLICIITACAACGNKTTTTETETRDTVKTAMTPLIATSQFKVWGNCEQCKETIESSLKVDGVVKADWNEDTKRMHVTYDESKITLDKIKKNVAAAGYDNDAYKGDDKAYSNLPECCQYERK